MENDFLTDTFVRLRQKLRSESRNIVRDPDEADDVLQDSFVRLWKKRYPLESSREAEALLRRTVRNASLNEARRKRGEPVPDDIMDDSHAGTEMKADYSALQGVLDKELTDVQKYILEEKVYGDRTSQDIADELGMEAPAVRMQLSRAKGKLRRALVAVSLMTAVLVVSFSIRSRGRYSMTTPDEVVTDKDAVMEDVRMNLSDFFTRQTDVETNLIDMFGQ